MTVYFIQSDGGPIKIGKSKNVWGRLNKMQSDSPGQLRILATSTSLDESDLHCRFAQHRIRGEWFSPATELLELIATLTKPVPPASLRAVNYHPLRVYIRGAGISGAEFAARVSITPSYISQITNGYRFPSRFLAVVIEKATGGAVTAEQLLFWSPATVSPTNLNRGV